MKFITKSLFVTFLDNSKLAWFKTNNKQYFDWINKFDDKDFKNYLIQLGKTAEDLTKEYLENKFGEKSCNISPFLKITDEDFDKGCLILDNKDKIKVNDTTKDNIQKRTKILYQPGFIFSNKFLISDFLVWNENTGKYDLYEVKAKTSIRDSKSVRGIKYSNAAKLKKDLQADISFQKYVIEKWFEKNFGENLLGGVYFVYLDKYFTKQGEVKPEDILIIDKMGEEREIIARSESQTDNGFVIDEMKIKVKNDYLPKEKIEETIKEIEDSIYLSEEEFNNKYPWDGTSWIKYFGPNILKILDKENLIEKVLTHEEDITKHTAYTIFGKGFRVPGNSKAKKQKVVELAKNKKCKFEDITKDKDTFDLFAKDSKGNLTTTGKLLNTYIFCKTQNRQEFLKEIFIKETLNSLKRYLIFYDYETISSPVPILENTRPYQQVPTQISIHIYDTQEGKINHFGLILIPGKENKLLQFDVSNIPESLILENNLLVQGNYDYFFKIFVEKVKEVIGDLSNGTYIVWNKAFENNVNKVAGILFPELEQNLLTINKNTFDLMEFYKNYDHFHIKSYGSYSIKYILPALSNDLSYKTLGIQKGDQAQKTLEKIINGSIEDNLSDKQIADKFKQELNDLFIYCGQDSFATYLIWKYLKNKVN